MPAIPTPGQGLTLQPPGQAAARPQEVTYNGLMSAKPLSTLVAEETAAAVARAQQAASEPVVSNLVSYVRTHWAQAKQAKQQVEKDLLSAVRAKRGEYDPEKLAAIRQQEGSEIYMMIFATKARQMKALLSDVLLSSGVDRPWQLLPSPVPELPPDEVSQIMQAVQEQVMQAEQAGIMVTVDQIRQVLREAKADLEQRVMEQARTEAERAESMVEDLLVEGGFTNAMEEFLDDLTTFKTAFIKGPVIHKAVDLKWTKMPEGNYEPVVTEAFKPHWYRVDPFSMYPAPNSKSVHDRYLFEHHSLTRGSLADLIGVDGYSEDAIRAVLEEHGTGGLRDWMAIAVEKAAAEGREVTGNNMADVIDALQYWGSVSGKMLREWGMSPEEVEDDVKEYEVEVWLIGNHVIKAAINPDPMLRRPYYADGFSRIPGAFWHNSLFDVIRDCCDMANAAARALANNMGISSGPQVSVNIDRLAEGEDPGQIYPWRLWQTKSDPMGSSAAPVSFFQPASNANELMGVFERFSLLADEYSGVPKYLTGMTGGEGGAGRTASGLSMMLGSASKQIKQTISSMDINVVEKVVVRAYQHLMQHAKGTEVKGDLQAKARGATSMIAKESAQVRTNEFLMATGNPVDMQIIGLDGRAELLRHAAKRLDINTERVVPSQSRIKVMQNMAQQQQAMVQAQGGANPAGTPPKLDGNDQGLMDTAPVTKNF